MDTVRDSRSETAINIVVEYLSAPNATTIDEISAANATLATLAKLNKTWSRVVRPHLYQTIRLVPSFNAAWYPWERSSVKLAPLFLLLRSLAENRSGQRDLVLQLDINMLLARLPKNDVKYPFINRSNIHGQSLLDFGNLSDHDTLDGEWENVAITFQRLDRDVLKILRYAFAREEPRSYAQCAAAALVLLLPNLDCLTILPTPRIHAYSVYDRDPEDGAFVRPVVYDYIRGCDPGEATYPVLSGLISGALQDPASWPGVLGKLRQVRFEHFHLPDIRVTKAVLEDPLPFQTWAVAEPKREMTEPYFRADNCPGLLQAPALQRVAWPMNTSGFSRIRHHIRHVKILDVGSAANLNHDLAALCVAGGQQEAIKLRHATLDAGVVSSWMLGRGSPRAGDSLRRVADTLTMLHLADIWDHWASHLVGPSGLVALRDLAHLKELHITVDLLIQPPPTGIDGAHLDLCALLPRPALESVRIDLLPTAKNSVVRFESMMAAETREHERQVVGLPLDLSSPASRKHHVCLALRWLAVRCASLHYPQLEVVVLGGYMPLAWRRDLGAALAALRIGGVIEARLEPYPFWPDPASSTPNGLGPDDSDSDSDSDDSDGDSDPDGFDDDSDLGDFDVDSHPDDFNSGW